MYRNYDEDVTRFSDEFIRVKVDANYADEIEKLASKIVRRKIGEAHHQLDNRQELKRFTTGFMGEAALEKLLGIDIIDWSQGDSADYHHPDIPGYRVGVKTVEKGKYPIIFKQNYYPQIMCIRSIEIPNLVFVCGLASTKVLNTYQDDNLILDPRLRSRNTKTGFYGYQHLTPVSKLDDIQFYKR